MPQGGMVEDDAGFFEGLAAAWQMLSPFSICPDGRQNWPLA